MDAYDDFRVTLRPRADGGYDTVAVGVGGAVHSGVFRLPFDDDELERAVLDVARHGPTRRATTRDVGGSSEPVEHVDPEQLGGALAEALITGDIATGYDAARRKAATDRRGLRLSISLAEAPQLLSVPWELLYRRPRFLANQRSTPLVRHLDTPDLPLPPAIDAKVRILGVVASPADCAALDVTAERARVEQAVRVVSERVELDWLEPATPRRLREALRDGVYHVLHYVGHSDFKADGEGVLYLEDGAGGHAEVDSTELANLLADQTSLRLVVLNSCEGARTSLTDPFAGVATTLVQLGVPAVVAMQFEISDAAAILFAEELYTNLIARQSPIDASVGEARKALYIELGGIEWATPVLFMGDVDVELFHFQVEPAAPPLPPPTVAAPPTAPPVDSEVEAAQAPAVRRRWGKGKVAAIAGAGALAVLAALVAIGVMADDSSDPTEPGAAGSTPASAAPPVAVNAPATDAVTTPAANRDDPQGAAPVSFEGAVTEPNEVVERPVELSAGQVVYLRGTTECGPNVVYSLRSPSGTEVGGAPYVCNDLGRVDISETGPWTIEVSGFSGGTGSFAIELVPVPQDRVEQVEVGDTITGEITAPGERHAFEFEAQANDIVYLRGDGPCGAEVEYRLLSPSDTSLSGAPYACDDLGRYVLAASGTHTVEVRSYIGGGGVYEIDLIAVRPDSSAQVAIGATLSGEITGPGEWDLFQFPGRQGELVGLDGAGPCGASAAMRLFTPDGSQQLGGTPDVCGDLELQELPSDGFYTVVVESYSGGTGRYEIVLTGG